MSDGGGQRHIFEIGTDASSGSVEFYAAGTTTPKDGWADETKASAITSLGLDARGIGSAFFDGDYKFIVKSSGGTTLYTWDNFKITSDTATMWEGNFGTSYPTAATANRWHLFSKHDGSNNFVDLGINDGDNFIGLTYATPADGYASLNAAISAIGATETDLLIKEQLSMTGNATVPSTMRLVIGNGGSVDQSSYTLTINGQVAAGLYKIFDGSGTVTFGDSTNPEVYPQWWGALGDDSNDDASAIQTAMSSGGAVYFSPATYKITSAITIPDTTTVTGGGKMSIIKSYSTTLNMFELLGSYYTIRDLKLTRDGTATAGAGIACTDGVGWYSQYENLYIEKQYDGINSTPNGGECFGDSNFVHIECNNNENHGYNLHRTRGVWEACYALRNGQSGFFVNNSSSSPVAGVTFKSAHSWNNNGRGFWFYSVNAASLIHDVWMESCIASFNNEDGFMFDCGGQNYQIVNCFSEYSGYVQDQTVSWFTSENQVHWGFFVFAEGQRLFDMQFSNCISAWNSYGGMILDDTKNINISNFLFKINGRALAHQVGLRIQDMVQVQVTGCQAYGTGASDQLIGIEFTADGGVNTNNNHIIVGNNLRGNSTTGMSGDPGDNSIVQSNLDVEIPTEASTATLSLPFSEVVKISGTTGITTITASWAGRRVTLLFLDVLTVTDGSNLALAGDFTTASGDTLTLCSDGTNWFETGRSSN